MSYSISHFYRFGEFAVDADQLVLLRGGKPVPLRPKVFDTLLVLVEHRGRIVGKNELMDRLWPDSFVEEDNLTFNIRQLRKALGDDARWPRYVETVARRGYRFIAEVEEVLADTGPTQGQVKVLPNCSEVNARVLSESGQASPTSEPGVISLPDDKLHNIGVEPNGPQALASPHSSVNTTRNPVLVVGAVAATLLLASAIWGWGFHDKSNQSPDRGEKVTGVFATSIAVPRIEKLTATGKNRHAVISFDGKYVAYTAEVRGRVSIWLRQLATGSVREVVTFTEGYIYGMAFAHSGEQLYFVKGYPEPTALYRVPMPLGGVPTKLISRMEGTFSLSPDDRQVAFLRYSDDDKECALMTANADGSNERELATHAQPDRFNTPAWSPDGQTIAVAAGPSDSGKQEVRIIELSLVDRAEKEVSVEKWFHISRLIWLPDKRGLITVGEKEPGGVKAIWSVSYPSGEARRHTDGPSDYVDVSLTADASKGVATQMTFTSDIWIGHGSEAKDLTRVTHAAGGFCWTPDERIIYASNGAADRNLWAMELDGTAQRQLTNAGTNLNPAVTPDGRFIVFVSNRDGIFQIWRMNADGSNQVKLTNGTGANNPAVSPDGQSVIYHSIEDWGLWKVSIEGGRPVRLSESFAVSPSFSPNGKLIACVGKGHKKDRRVIILPIEGGGPLRNLDLAPLELASYRLQWERNANAVFYAASREGVTGLYRQSLDGGLPEKLFEFSEDDIFDFSYSPKRHHLAAIRGGWQFDVVLLSDLNE